MKTKIIPFDLETAKKIQAGEIEGEIKTREGVKIHEFFYFSKVAVGAYGIYATIDGLVHSYCYDGFERRWDRSGKWRGDLVLEVPDNEPQFKPFDKVLVRGGRSTAIQENDIWVPAHFQHQEPARYEGDDEIYLASGMYWRECIPYAGNESLVGTTDKPKEE